MSIRKNIDYSTMFDAMRVAMSADMSQIKLYYELGRLICQRTEKGAAVAAAEYLQRNYPDVPGLSPRNLRRMRDFYRMYEKKPASLDLAMDIGWTQNVVILETDLNTEEQRWYLCAVKQFGWSKAELQKRIKSRAHQEVHLDESENQCYTKYKNNTNKQSCEEDRAAARTLHTISIPLDRGNRKSDLSPCLAQAIYVWHQPTQKTGPPAHKQRPWTVRFFDW